MNKLLKIQKRLHEFGVFFLACGNPRIDDRISPLRACIGGGVVVGGGSLRRLSPIGYLIIPFTLALIAALPIKFKLLKSAKEITSFTFP